MAIVLIVTGSLKTYQYNSTESVLSHSLQKPELRTYNEYLVQMKEAAEQMSFNTERDQQFVKLYKKLENAGTIDVIVQLRVSYSPEGYLNRDNAKAAQRALIKSAGNSIIQEINGYDANSILYYESVPVIALKVNAAGLASLEQSNQVIDIKEDLVTALQIPTAPNSVSSSSDASLLRQSNNYVSLNTTTKLIGAQKLWSLGFKGKNVAIAVIDDGVDSRHSFLASKVVSEACFSSTDSASKLESICPGGRNSTSKYAATPCNECDHGTHVAGIASGKEATFSGVAPEAQIIAINVFSKSYNNGDCGRYSDGSYAPTPCLVVKDRDKLLALQHVYNLKDKYNISAVNYSIGGGAYNSYCDNTRFDDKFYIDLFKSVGIAFIAPSGNERLKESLNTPACISSAISVGNVDTTFTQTNSETVWWTSNSSSILTLLAPGTMIRSSIPGNKYSDETGTSMAVPHVTGSFALIRSVYPYISKSIFVDIVKQAMIDTGKIIKDSSNNIEKPRIQLDNAVASLGPSYNGDVSMNCSNISGWYADKLRRNVALPVSVYDGTSLVTTVVADNFNSISKTDNNDSGFHGFSLNTPIIFKDGKQHSITVGIGPQERRGWGPNSVSKLITCQPVPRYAGNFDSANCSSISGWAADLNRLSQSIDIELYSDNIKIQTVKADLIRSDVAKAIGDNGKHGFIMSVPKTLKDNKTHTLTVNYESSKSVLSSSPKQVRCRP